MRRASVILLGPTLVAMAACGAGDDAASDTVAEVTTSGDPTTPSDVTGPGTTAASSSVPEGGAPSSTAPSPTDPPPTSSGSTVGPGRHVARAVADLVERTGVSADAVTVVSSENVTWRDSSLGCPREGMQYMQVLTDGVRIVLEADGQRYQYHGGGRRPVFYCPDPEPPVGE